MKLTCNILKNVTQCGTVFKHLLNINDNTRTKLCKISYVIALRNKIKNHIKLPTFYKVVQNLTDVTFSREELKVVELGFQ